MGKGKGKEEEGTEPGLFNTGLVSAALETEVETADTSLGPSKTPGSLGLAASLGSWLAEGVGELSGRS